MTSPKDAPKPPDIHNRAREWDALERMWRHRRAQLAFVLGRRRVGKSHVLSRFAREVGGLYYQATKRTEAEQLAQLSRLIGDHFADPALRKGVTLPSWEQLFGYLGERTGGEPFLLVLDEFPYLSAAAPALPSIVQRVWDHEWQASRMRLVLSGSFVTAMRALEEADQPLYGRRTLRLLFGPFTFADAGEFVPTWSSWDRLVAYSAFGNLPGHLALADPGRPVPEAAAAALLDATGPLVDDAQHMLDAFVADARMHYSILEAIAQGEHTWSGITSRVGQSGGALLRPLRWLEDMGLVERVVPFTEKAPQRSKRALYRISDPYLTFWHRFVAPLVQSGTLGLAPPQRLWAEVVEPALSEHMGPVFEEVCRQFVRAATDLPIRPLRVGEWWDVRSENQVDIVATDGEGGVFIAECKLGGVTRRDLESLRSRAALLTREIDGVRRVHLALFSARDRADTAVEKAVATGDLHWYRLDEMAGTAR